MKRLIRKINKAKVKRVASLSAITVAYVAFIILMEPLYTFLAQVIYVSFSLWMLFRLWLEGMRDWDVLVVA